MVAPPDSRDISYEGRDLEAMAGARNYHRWIRDEFRDCLAGDVAEVGAGDGRFASQLLEAPLVSLTLFEPSKSMFDRQCQNVDDGRVRRENACLADRRDAYAGAFDTVIYNNVLEHIEDDREELRIAYGTMKARGHVCVFVPALSVLMSRFDRSIGHLRRYSLPQLREALVYAGFEVRRIHYVDAPGILPWLVFMRWGQAGLDIRKVQIYDRLAIPLVRWFETRVRPPIGRNLIAIAQRP